MEGISIKEFSDAIKSHFDSGKGWIREDGSEVKIGDTCQECGNDIRNNTNHIFHWKECYRCKDEFVLEQDFVDHAKDCMDKTQFYSCNGKRYAINEYLNKKSGKDVFIPYCDCDIMDGALHEPH